MKIAVKVIEDPEDEIRDLKQEIISLKKEIIQRIEISEEDRNTILQLRKALGE